MYLAPSFDIKSLVDAEIRYDILKIGKLQLFLPIGEPLVLGKFKLLIKPSRYYVIYRIFIWVLLPRLGFSC